MHSRSFEIKTFTIKHEILGWLIDTSVLQAVKFELTRVLPALSSEGLVSIERGWTDGKNSITYLRRTNASNSWKPNKS